MDRSSAESEARFESYVDGLVEVIGHADRAGPMRDYCTGLLLPGERKSVEPMAALTAPRRAAAQHQSLLHFVGQAPWSDDEVLAKVRQHVLPKIERSGPIRVWIIDDTGFPKKGKHSVGVARQYCGQLGKHDNCQVAVTLSVANDSASLPIGHRLYLPEDWASDAERRKKAGVPGDIFFQTKPKIALDLIKAAHAADVAPGVILGDAGYGVDTDFRSRVTELGRSYVMGVTSAITVWPPGKTPLPPKQTSGRGRPARRLRRDEDHQPVPAKELALDLPARAWKTVTWREGTRETLKSRFARVRVRPAHCDFKLSSPRPEEWLLIEWPKGEDEPTKYWLSTLPDTAALYELVDFAKLRWRIERDYQDLKQEIGLDHYEGRGWRGFHHHITLCIAAYGFLISERETIPPSGPRKSDQRQAPAVSEGFAFEAAPASRRTSRRPLDRDLANAPQRGHRAQA